MGKKQKTIINIDKHLLQESEKTIEILLQNGVHFGHSTPRWNPLMKKYIYTVRDGVHIIDLVKTIENFNLAAKALAVLAGKGDVLFVGTKPQAREVVKDIAVNIKSPFVVQRWPGGLLTNFDITLKSIKKLNTLHDRFIKGIDNRTKKELLNMKKELERLEYLYSGVKGITKKPACIVVVDPKNSRIAVREANKMKIPVIAMLDTNASPQGINFPIPANDDSIMSITYLISKLGDIVFEIKKGEGIEYKPVDFAQIEDIIQNMAKVIEERKNAKSGNSNNPDQPKVLRVTRSEVQRVQKNGRY